MFGLRPQVFTPVWLLDGLDELASPIADRGLWDSLRALPGEAALTCRAAVFQAARAEIGDLIGSEWRILGLKPTQEQADFLAEAYADEKIDRLETRSIRPIAALPARSGTQEGAKLRPFT